MQMKKGMLPANMMYTVGTWRKDRDCLWNIAKKPEIYNDPFAWPKIWHANRDLIHNPSNALASTANYLKGYGWQRGQSWGEGTANFQVLLQWNSSQVYTKTVAYFAQQLDRD